MIEKINMQTFRKLFLLLTCLPLLLAAACGTAEMTVDERLSDASDAIAAKDYGYAQSVCDNLAVYISAEDSVAMDERQAATLAMLFMSFQTIATRMRMWLWRHSACNMPTGSPPIR